MAEIPRAVEAVILRAKDWYDEGGSEAEASEILVALVEAIEVHGPGFASGPMAMNGRKVSVCPE